jgi:hypothetical protein
MLAVSTLTQQIITNARIRINSNRNTLAHIDAVTNTRLALLYKWRDCYAIFEKKKIQSPDLNLDENNARFGALYAIFKQAEVAQCDGDMEALEAILSHLEAF